MTHEEASYESTRIYLMVTEWNYPTPWQRALIHRWSELLQYAIGQTDRQPDPDWTLESIAHLKGSPEGGTDPGEEEE